MAAVRKKSLLFATPLLKNRGVSEIARRHFRVKPVWKEFQRKEDEDRPLKVAARQTLASLADRGFCRPTKSYQPIDGIEHKLKDICQDVLEKKMDKNSWTSTPLTDPLLKYRLLTRCIREFGHDVPNSCLMNIASVGDALDYFTTPVQGSSPYESIVQSQDKLPKNLHAIAEPVRFHPETDTFFGGVSAYPGSSTLVTGLKAKKKFRGYNANPKWPYE